MRITIENLKGEDDLDIFELNITVPRLMSMLWNIPEKSHGSIFRRDNPEARMSEPRAREKIKVITDKYSSGSLDIEIENLKHNKSKRSLGLKLIGHKKGQSIKWHEVIINQKEFLSHRDESEPNQLLRELMVKLSREEIHQLLKDKPDGSATHDPILVPTFDSKDSRPISLNPTGGNLNAAEQENQSLFKRILFSPILHGVLSALVSGAALYFAKMSMAVTVGASLSLGALTWGIESFYSWRKKSIKEGHNEFSRMSDKAISQLDEPTKHALRTGLEANSWPAWGKSAFNLDAWKKFRAYGAGLEASKHEGDPLVKRINQFAKAG